MAGLRMIDDIHVIPINDLIEHEASDRCVCGPALDAIIKRDGQVRWLLTHHSLDGREQREQPACQ